MKNRHRKRRFQLSTHSEALNYFLLACIDVF